MNTNLNKAKDVKNDEFYTQLPDIEHELEHYWEHFKGKVVYCNCDDPSWSQFYEYFSLKFKHLGLKKLITTCYAGRGGSLSGHGACLIYNGEQDENNMPDNGKMEVHPLEGDGDFRSPECVELLKEADIVVTNPPFSLFREFIDQLMRYKKQFLVIGNKNAITYKGIFELIRDNRLWLGYTTPANFVQPDGTFGKLAGLTRWFTNLDTTKRHEIMPLGRIYEGREQDYPKYDNYDAIEVSKTRDIPMDYSGVMGVPITFLDKYCAKQFVILGSNRGINQDPDGVYGRGSHLNGKETFKRLFIQRRNGKL